MDKTGLRIGNIITNTLCSYDRIKTGSDIDLAQFYEPVPLTHEGLQDLGFYSDIFFEGDSPVYTLQDRDFFIDFDTFQPIDSGFPIASYKLEYIHQIQNLYFALTGEELGIKEKA